MAYLSQADIEARYGDLSDEQISYLDTLLPGIDANIEMATGTVFDNSESSTEYVSGADTKTLIIPTMSDVTAVYSVGEDGEETLIDDSAWAKYPSGKSYVFALRNKQGTWDEGYDNYRVDGVLGYANVPADIKSIALEMAVNNLTANVSGLKSEKVGDWAASYSDGSAGTGLSDASATTLTNYRRLSRSV